MFNLREVVSGCSNHLKAAFRKKEAVKDAVAKEAPVAMRAQQTVPKPTRFRVVRKKCTLKGGFMAP